MSIVLQLKLLGLSLLVLTEISASIAYVNHIVRFRSGLNSTETLRRVWTRPEQVIFQPVVLPIVLSWVVGLGVNSLVRSMMVGFLQLIDALRISGELSLAGDFAVTVSGTAAGTLASALLYIIDGGMQLSYQVLGTLVISLGVSLPRIVGNAPKSALIIWIIVISGIVICTSFWIQSRGVMARVPMSSVRDLRSALAQSSISSNTGLKYALSFVIIMGLLIVLRLIDHLVVVYIERSGYEQVYLAQMLRNFAGLMVLISCCFVAILITNENMTHRIFIWQWPSVVCPMFMLGLCETLLTVFYKGHPSPAVKWHILLSIIKRTFMYGGCGFVGAAAYLAVLARAAGNALDPGIEGQGELIVDDDEDSEYEIDP